MAQQSLQARAPWAIAVRDVRKHYQKVEALRGITMNVKWGEMYGFLGPNGAGKSTLIQILTTLLVPTTGDLQVAGLDVALDPDGVRRQIGVALQDTGVDPLLTGRELLVLQGRLFGLRKADTGARARELLHEFGLTEAADRRLKTYSGGMRRRLDLALALMHIPPILFLDEPTTGLDPVNRVALWELLRKICREWGTTVFMTTQYLEEADALCDRIAIIHEGVIVAQDTPTALKRRLQRDVIEVQLPSDEDAPVLTAALQAAGFEASSEGAVVRLYSSDASLAIGLLLPMIADHGWPLQGLKVTPPSLDDVFLQLTQGSADEGRRPTWQ